MGLFQPLTAWLDACADLIQNRAREFEPEFIGRGIGWLFFDSLCLLNLKWPEGLPRQSGTDDVAYWRKGIVCPPRCCRDGRLKIRGRRAENALLAGLSS